jgi:hypothetical protein
MLGLSSSLCIGLSFAWHVCVQHGADFGWFACLQNNHRKAVRELQKALKMPREGEDSAVVAGTCHGLEGWCAEPGRGRRLNMHCMPCS